MLKQLGILNEHKKGVLIFPPPLSDKYMMI